MEILRNDGEGGERTINGRIADGRDNGGKTGGHLEIISGGDERVVTDLKPAVRSENRVNVFLDGKFEFSLDLAQVVELGVKKGQRLTKVEVERLRAESNFGKLYQRSLEWALMRPRSVRETRNYLKRRQVKRAAEGRVYEREKAKAREDGGVRGFNARGVGVRRARKVTLITDEEIERVVERLCERGYVDDLKFTRYFLENRMARKGVSRRRLEQELVAKGISREMISEELAAVGRNEREEILKVMARKRGKYDDEKLVAYLVRQGFSYDLVREVVTETKGN